MWQIISQGKVWIGEIKNQKKDADLLCDDDLVSSLNLINDQAQYLSQTIDTFKNFIRGSEEKKVSSLCTILYKAIDLVSSSMKNNYIDVQMDRCDNTLSLDMIEDELIQVVINIFNNAKDALVQNNIEHPLIIWSLKRDDQIAVITIEDNGGGIPQNILPHIFEPYFTTKHQSQATGLGLSLSHQIITKSFHGKIYAKNTQNGVKFVIEIPL